MELNQIRYFIMTAQFQNMSQASRALGIAQPTLSKSISSLENELGTQLFDRLGKKLVLNERGRRFLAGAMSAVEELDNMVEAARDRSVGVTLSLGLFCVSERFMRCVGEFARTEPGVIFDISRLHGDPGGIDTNKFDMLLYPYDTRLSKYKGQLVYTESYGFAVHRGNPLASRKSVCVSELSGARLVFVRYDEKTYDLPYHLYHSSGGLRKNHMYTNSYELQRHMVSSGYCSGFVPEGYSETYSSDGDIRLMAVDDKEFRQDIHIGFKRDKHLNESGRAFSAFVHKYFDMMGEYTKGEQTACHEG